MGKQLSRRARLVESVSAKKPIRQIGQKGKACSATHSQPSKACPSLKHPATVKPFHATCVILYPFKSSLAPEFAEIDGLVTCRFIDRAQKDPKVFPASVLRVMNDSTAFHRCEERGWKGLCEIQERSCDEGGEAVAGAWLME